MDEPTLLSPSIEPSNHIPNNMDPLNTDPLLTVFEVARYLRVKPATVRAMAKRGQMPAIKVGRGWRFRMTSVKNWAAETGSTNEPKLVP